MLNKYISQQIIEAFGHKPTKNQEEVFKNLGIFLMPKTENEIFLLRGYAGTGKTSVIAGLVKATKTLKLKVVLLAPTGRAAKVLSNYTNKQAFTVHKKIYRQKTNTPGFGKFDLDRNLHTDTIFIVDEVSMINNSAFENSNFGTGRMLDDLITYVYSGKNCKLILSGDTAQLPPVNFDFSPALDKKTLEGYDMAVVENELTEVVRQAENSGILTNATNLRKNIADLQHEEMDFPKIDIANFNDINYINGRELIDAISDAYAKHGENRVAVICRSNKRANRFNLGIRNSVLYMEDELTVGDLLMVVKNNYFYKQVDTKIDFIANGDIAQIKKIHGYEERYGFRFADLSLSFPDYNDFELDAKVLLDTLQSEQASLSKDDFNKLYQNIILDFPEIKNKRKLYQKLKESPYMNALQVKYAYAFTCHKAQGGQWNTVFIDHGFINKDMINHSFYRWLYTAFTRAESELYLINFNKNFFPKNTIEYY